MEKSQKKKKAARSKNKTFESQQKKKKKKVYLGFTSTCVILSPFGGGKILD